MTDDAEASARTSRFIDLASVAGASAAGIALLAAGYFAMVRPIAIVPLNTTGASQSPATIGDTVKTGIAFDPHRISIGTTTRSVRAGLAHVRSGRDSAAHVPAAQAANAHVPMRQAVAPHVFAAYVAAARAPSAHVPTSKAANANVAEAHAPAVHVAMARARAVDPVTAPAPKALVPTAHLPATNARRERNRAANAEAANGNGSEVLAARSKPDESTRAVRSEPRVARPSPTSKASAPHPNVSVSSAPFARAPRKPIALWQPSRGVASKPAKRARIVRAGASALPEPPLGYEARPNFIGAASESSDGAVLGASMLAGLRVRGRIIVAPAPSPAGNALP